MSVNSTIARPLTLSMPLARSEQALPCYRISVTISGKAQEYGSHAIRVMGQLLSGVGPLYLVSLEGGGGKIAGETWASALVVAQRDPRKRLPIAVRVIQGADDPQLQIAIEPAETAVTPCDAMSTGLVMSLLQVLPCGNSACPSETQATLRYREMATEPDALRIRLDCDSDSGEKQEKLISRVYRIAKEHGADSIEERSAT